MKQFLDHALNLFILIIILGIGILSFISLQGNPVAQLLIGIVIAIAYSVWGLIHHWIVGSWHRKVVVEYVLIGAIAVTMLLIILGS